MILVPALLQSNGAGRCGSKPVPALGPPGRQHPVLAADSRTPRVVGAASPLRPQRTAARAGRGSRPTLIRPPGRNPALCAIHAGRLQTPSSGSTRHIKAFGQKYCEEQHLRVAEKHPPRGRRTPGHALELLPELWGEQAQNIGPREVNSPPCLTGPNAAAASERRQACRGGYELSEAGSKCDQRAAFTRCQRWRGWHRRGDGKGPAPPVENPPVASTRSRESEQITWHVEGREG